MINNHAEPFDCFLIGEQGTLLIQCGNRLLDKGHAILGVISPNPSITNWAKGKDIPYITSTDDMVRFLSEKPFDYLFSIANWTLLPGIVLDLPRRYAINYHDSLLPSYGGGNATTWAIMNREREHGITWHVMASRVDAGDIVKQAPIKIDKEETAFSLNGKCYEMAIESFGRLIEELSTGSESLRKQNREQSTYFPRFKKPYAGGVLFWDRSASELDAFVRALDFGAYPNLVCLPKFVIDNDFIIATKLNILDASSSSPPGTITKVDQNYLGVSTASLDIALSRLFTMDGQALSVPDFVKMFGVCEGDTLTVLSREKAAGIEHFYEKNSKQENFWYEILETLQPLSVPFRKMHNVPGRRKGHVSIEDDLAPEVHEFLEKHNPVWCPGEFLFAAFAVYMARLGGAADFDIGLLDFHLRKELSGLNRHFSLEVPCRIGIDLEKHFEDTFETLREQVALTKRKKSYPLDFAVRYRETLGPVLNSRDEPLFPVKVEWVKNSDNAQATCKNSLTMVIPADGKKLCWVYNSGVYDENTIERIFYQFTGFMRNLVKDTSCHLVDIPLVVEEQERHQLLIEWNDTLSDYPRDRCLHQLFEDQVTKCPDHIAAVFQDQKLSYAQLNEKANQLALFLRDLGVRSNTIVGIMIDRSLEMLVGILGIIKAGGAYLPIDSNYPDTRIEYIFENSKMGFLLSKESRRKNSDIIRGFQGRVVDIEDPRIDLKIVENPEILNSPSDAVYVIYTSGSTGTPKGVVIEHRGLLNYAWWARKNYAQDQSRRDAGPLAFPLFTSLSFDLTVTSIFVPLISGNKIVVYQEDEGQLESAIGRVIKDNAVDVIKLTPSHLSIVGGSDLKGSQLKRMIIGGEDLNTGLAQSIHDAFGGDIEIYNEYGPTEATVGCMIHRFNPEKDIASSVPIGKPAGNVKLYIMDRHLNLLPVGVSGELYISGDGVARGYLNRPDFNARAFIPNPFAFGERLYRTGDLARWRPDGVMEFLGRIDHQVKIRGYRMELGEIENKLMQHENITQCVVEARHDEAPQNPISISYCARCGLPSNYPDTQFDENEICNTCKDFDRYQDKAMDYFKTIEDLEALFANTGDVGTIDYDCVMLYSGGKDSTYVLYQLVKKMRLRVLAYTFDNGYISEAAKENIKRVVNELGVDSITERSSHINAIYVDSLKSFGNVCNGCFKTIYTLSMNLAYRKGIKYIVTGLSRGQLFESRLAALYKTGVFDPDEIEDTVLESRKVYHRLDDLTARTLDVSIFQTDSVFEAVQFIDFYKYSDVTVDEIFEYLEKHAPWIKTTAGGCSTNCMINDAGIYIHKKERGYHNYALPNSWEVRLGHKSRETAIEELNADIDASTAKKILREIGYHHTDRKNHQQREKRLVAYYCSDNGLVLKQLRSYLLQSLPDYMVPSCFIRLDHIPLTANGKVNRRALPVPERRSSQFEQDYVMPRTDTEKRIAAIWEELLHVEKVGTQDNFFELGGQSLIATRVLSRMRDLFSVGLPLSTLIKTPTVGGVADLIETIRQTTQMNHDTVSGEREEGIL